MSRYIGDNECYFQMLWSNFWSLKIVQTTPSLCVYLMSCRPYPHHNKAANGHLSIIHNDVLAHQITVDSLLNILALKYRFTILVIMDA